MKGEQGQNSKSKGKRIQKWVWVERWRETGAECLVRGIGYIKVEEDWLTGGPDSPSGPLSPGGPGGPWKWNQVYNINEPK